MLLVAVISLNGACVYYLGYTVRNAIMVRRFQKNAADNDCIANGELSRTSVGLLSPYGILYYANASVDDIRTQPPITVQKM